MSSFTDQDIFNYLDGTCTKTESLGFEAELEQNNALQQRYQELKALNRSLSELAVEPSPEPMVDKVMEEVRALPKKDYAGSSTLFSGTHFFIISGILTAIVALISIFNAGYLEVETLETTAENYRFLEEWTFLKGLLTKKMLTNAVLLIYGVLGLALLDRAILNPLFRRKVKRLSL